MSLAAATLSTPLGPLEVVTSGGLLCAIAFGGQETWLAAHLARRFGPSPVERHDALGEVTDRLAAYFAGNMTALDPLSVDTGGTTFQRRVWEALRTIPPGRTISYGELARKIWRPSACRAVGTAAGRNPIPIVLPCHRVISVDGKIGGYAGGLDRKRWLLSHEQGQSDMGSGLSFQL